MRAIPPVSLRKAKGLLALLLLCLPSLAEAKDCGWNSDRTNYNCDGFFSGADIGGSAPLMGDTLEGNPAALPTQPTPFGLEGVFSNRSSPKGKPKFSASTVKGFDGFGFGIGSWSEGTFSAPDFDNHFLGSPAYQEFQQYQSNPSSVIGFRLGTTVVLPQGPFPRGIRVSVGGSLGLGRVYGKLAPQWGFLVKFFFLGLGYSESYERLSEALPKNKIVTMSAGLPLGPLYLGYSQITVNSSVNKTKANVLSVRWTSPLWTIYGNAKLQKDHRGEPDSWIRAGAQRRFGKNGRFGTGYEYGLYRYSHSAIFQFYL